MAQVAHNEPHRSDYSLERILKRFEAIQPLVDRRASIIRSHPLVSVPKYPWIGDGFEINYSLI